jgi:hypothetical protein
MATILEEAAWTITEAAAERMAENGLLKKCEHEYHTQAVMTADLPVYHRSDDAPSWFGFSTMDQAIRSAEAHAAGEKESEAFMSMGAVLDPVTGENSGWLGDKRFEVYEDLNKKPETKDA